MKGKKRRWAVLSSLLLAAFLVLPARSSGAAPQVYITAINDKICDLPGKITPLSLNGTIYAPYTIFDHSSTGVDVGVYYGLTMDSGMILTLYSKDRILVFQMTQLSCEDGQGNRIDLRPAVRYGTPYIPLAAVCNYFGITYSFLPTADRGTLIRISNGSVRMSDSQFLIAASSQMQTRYDEALQRMPPEARPSPTPTPTQPPVSTPSPNDLPPVYLAVDASDMSGNLSELFQNGTYALLLYRPESLASHSQQIRQAVAAGNQIGLIVDGSLQEALEQLEEGNRLLTHIARIRTRIVLAPRALTEQLRAESWFCWQANVTGSSAGEFMRSLGQRRGPSYVLLPSDLSVIRQTLSRLRSAGYTFAIPVETALS